jgi:hypothetical protein
MNEIINTLIKKHIIPKYGLSDNYDVRNVSYYPYTTNSIIIKFEYIWGFDSLPSLHNEMSAVMKSVGLFNIIISIIHEFKGKRMIVFKGEYYPQS